MQELMCIREENDAHCALAQKMFIKWRSSLRNWFLAGEV